MKHKTNELTGAALDAAVAVNLGWMTRGTGEPITNAAEWVMPNGMKGVECPPSYSSDWAHGGPIIERENIVTALLLIDDDNFMNRAIWCAWVFGLEGHYAVDTSGGTPDATGDSCLTAAMRAFVFSRHGDTVDL